jgi:hypothetical protein
VPVMQLAPGPDAWLATPVRLPGAAGPFAEALREDSNLAMDWLWWATRVTSPADRRHCLERALRIDPRCDEARAELAALSRRARAAAGKLAAE